MKIDLKRKTLGLLCILWVIGFTFLLGILAEGLKWGIVLFFTRTIFIFLVPPYVIWMLPCLLTGLYQLFLKKHEGIDKFILYLGAILSVIGCLIFFFSGILHYNPTVPHEHIMLAIIAGAGLFIILSGLWNLEKTKTPLFLKIRPVLTFLIVLLLAVMSYSAVYGRPFLYDPMVLFLVHGNVYEEPGLKTSTYIQLKFVKADGAPIPYLELDLISEEIPKDMQHLYGVGILKFSSYTNKEGITIFKIPPLRYKLRFNFATFPKELLPPEEEIWVELKEGETTQLTIQLLSK